MKTGTPLKETGTPPTRHLIALFLSIYMYNTIGGVVKKVIEHLFCIRQIHY